MNEHHSHRMTILPVSDGVQRPVLSVMIPTYNCADYLRETLASVLAQDPGSDIMQIEVVDDCSTKDDPKAVVEQLGQGRVSFYQQPENVGHVKNFNTCLQRSRGKLIHLLHGDDCVMHGFYQKMQRLFEQYPTVGAAFCRHVVMDDRSHYQRFSPLEQPENGILDDWLERVAIGNPLQTPSIVVKRDVYEHLGAFDQRILSCGEDWEMWVRIAANYPVAYETEPLAAYRDNSGSLTKRSIRSGQNIRDSRLVTEIIRSYLPESVSTQLSKQARENCASWALHFSRQMIATGDTAAAMTQIQEGLKCSLSSEVVKAASLLTLKAGKKWFQQKLLGVA